MARIAPVPARGTRDFLPRDLVRRNAAFTLLRSTFERYGYEPLETPAIESSAVLEGKYGEEGERLLFRILKRGQDLEESLRTLGAEDRSAGAIARQLSDQALRYDLTVPFARVIAAHQNDLVLPFRRYQMQPVWRADRPQRGRYRELYQCDVDCVGSRSLTVEAELLAMVHEVLLALGFADFTIRINSRGLLAALYGALGIAEERQVGVLTAVDKLDKIGPEGVRTELERLDLPSAAPARIVEVLGMSGTPRALLEDLRPLVGGSAAGQTALAELGELFGYLDLLGVPGERYRFDVSLARGLGYYTGVIYEAFAAGSGVGSLVGGGRYDRLIGLFSGRDLPCVGVSFGIDRIFAALETLSPSGSAPATATQVLVPLFAQETLGAAFALARDLRAAGIRTEVYAEPKELRPQLAFAAKKGIPLACILGPDEVARGEVTLRDLRAGEQHSLPRAEVVARAQALLGA